VSLALWRDIALVWLALLCFIGLIVPLAVAVFAVKGMHAAVDHTPRLLHKAQGYSRALRTHTDATSQRVSEPVIQFRSRSTQVSTFLDRLLRRPAAPWRRGEKK
jgi:hypothetical protein